MGIFDQGIAELNDAIIELQGRTGGFERLRREVFQGDGIQSLQGLSAQDLRLEGAASGARIVITTNGVDVITLLLVDLPLGQVITERTVTATDSLAPATDRLVLLDPTAAPFAFTLTAPGSPDSEHQDFYFKNLATNGNAVTLVGTVDGQANYVFSGSLQTLHLFWNGTVWRVIGGI